MKGIKNFTQWFFFKLGWKWLFWILYPEIFFKIGLMGGKTKKVPKNSGEILGTNHYNSCLSPKAEKNRGYYFQKHQLQPKIRKKSWVLFSKTAITAQSITVQYTEVHSNPIIHTKSTTAKSFIVPVHERSHDTHKDSWQIDFFSYFH